MKRAQKSLFQLTILYSIGSFSSRLMSFVLIFFTTFFLSTDEVGHLDLIFVTLNLAIPVVTFQISDAAFRWLLEDDSNLNRTKVFSNVSILLVISFCLYGLAYLIYDQFISAVDFFLFPALVFFQMFNGFFSQFVRGIGNNKEYVIRSLTISFLYVLFSIIALVYLQLKVEGLIYANILAGFAGSVLLVVRTGLYRYFKTNEFSFAFSKKLLAYSTPLMPNNLSWWAVSSANRYIILILLGASANGIFAIAFKLPTILSMFISIFYLAWQEKAIRNYNNEDRDNYYSLTLAKFLRYLFSLAILILAMNKFVLQFIVSEKFHSAWQYTPVLLVGLIFNSIAGFYGTGFLSTKKTKGALTSSFVSALLTIILSFLAIPIIGLHGASLAICVGYLVLCLIRVKQMKKFFSIRFPTNDFIHFSCLFALVALLSLGGVFLQVISIVTAILSVILINFDELKFLVKKITIRKLSLSNDILKVPD